MIQRYFRTPSPRRATTLPEIVSACLVLATILVFAPVERTLAQPSSTVEPLGREMITEIWMSGDDVVVSRRIPVEREPNLESDHEFARSMANLAEQHFQSSDETTAGWLVQWAQKLSNGRIGANGLDADHHAVQLVAEVERSGTPQTRAASTEGLLTSSSAAVASRTATTATPHVDSETQAVDDHAPPFAADHRLPESPIIQANASQPTRRESVDTTELWPSAIAGDAAAVGPQTRSARAEATAELSEPIATFSQTVGRDPTITSPVHPTEERPAVVRMQPRRLTSLGDRQVALADPRVEGVMTSPAEAGRRDPPNLPGNAIPEPTFVVLVSFTSGFVFCVGLVALIALAPRRRSHHDTGIATSSRFCESPADVRDEVVQMKKRDHPTGQVATSHTLASNAPTAAHRETVEPDKTSSLVEDFFSSNVEMLKQCA